MQERIEKQRGQGMAEYLIVVSLIALACIAAFSALGQTIRGQTAQLSAQVAGGTTEAVHANSTAPGGSGKHCCGVRGNPPGPTESPTPDLGSGV